MPPKPLSPEEKKLRRFLTYLGLSPDETTLYTTLTNQGPLTPLQLSRKTGIPRTRVYRVLEQLQHQKLVESIIDEHRTLAQAVPPDQLEKLLHQKQSQVTELIQLFPQIQHYLQQQINRRQPDTKVMFYRGQEGLRQMVWNTLRTKKELLGYTSFRFESAVGSKFAQSYYQQFCAQKLTMREIYSDVHICSIGGLDKLWVHQPPHPEYTNHFFSRYLPDDKLKINHQTDIYNQVVSYYDWAGDEIFGVEIYNAKIAAMQRQIFEILWPIAIPEDQIITRP